MRKTFLHGIAAGMFAAMAAMVYNLIYCKALVTDFSKVVNPVTILSANIFVCLLASAGYYFFSQRVKKGADAWFNIIILVFTFVTFIIPFSVTLPLDVKSPELFPGLAIPLHLFPALFWITTKPWLGYKSGK